jgi:hypothetical protein
MKQQPLIKKRELREHGEKLQTGVIGRSKAASSRAGLAVTNVLIRFCLKCSGSPILTTSMHSVWITVTSRIYLTSIFSTVDYQIDS